LVILDNLEALSADALGELLTVAKDWSEIGGSRVLMAARSPDFNHSDYPVEGSLVHQSLVLGGLAEYDAWAYVFSAVVEVAAGAGSGFAAT